MNFIERVMRIMTQVNIGAALGMVAWLLWSGWQIVTGQIAPAHNMVEVQAVMRLAHSGGAARLHLVPAQAGSVAAPHCHEAPPSPSRVAAVLTGEDL